MTKFVDQLTVADLKLAFKETVLQQYGVASTREVAASWFVFWGKLADKCRVVERADPIKGNSLCPECGSLMIWQGDTETCLVIHEKT